MDTSSSGVREIEGRVISKICSWKEHRPETPAARADSTPPGANGPGPTNAGAPMTDGKRHPDNAASLRRRAEKAARARAAEIDKTLSPEAAREALHELRVHQIELEMQNDELRRAQAELEAAQARFLELYDLAPVGYCTLSEEGVILEANLTMATLLDVARGDLVAQPLSRFVLPEDQDVWYLRRKALFVTDSVPAFPVRMVRAKRGQFWARIEATVAPDAEGARTCLVSLSDVTEHKQAADDLEASAGYWQETFDALSDAVSLVTPEGQILRCNRAHETLLGKPVAEIVGHTCFELIHKTKSPIAGCPSSSPGKPGNANRWSSPSGTASAW